jgi:hypothetical protein
LGADDIWLAGYLDAHLDHLTQGKTHTELEEMLAYVYRIRQEEEKQRAQKRKSGVPRIEVPA